MADTVQEKPVESPQDDGTPRSEEDLDQELTSINEKSLLRKIDAQLLPAVGILYLLSFLDRSNGNEAPHALKWMDEKANKLNSRQRENRRASGRRGHE